MGVVLSWVFRHGTSGCGSVCGTGIHKTYVYLGFYAVC